MFSSFEWLLAFRYLRTRRQEGFISVIAWFSLIGIALGVATLIIVMSVMNGFRQELLTRILGINGHVRVYGVERTISDSDYFYSALRNVEGVRSIDPMIEGQVMAAANGNSVGAIVKGISPSNLAERPIIADNITKGNLNHLGSKNGVIIGSKLAHNLRINVGDKVTLISPKGSVTAFGTVPRLRSYFVVGLFNVGMHEYDSSFIFMPLKSAQLYFNLLNKVNYLDLMLIDPNLIGEVIDEIKSIVGSKGRIYDWQQTNSSFFNAIQVERNVMFLILTLIIIVAAFNIISSLIMLVKDKVHDIGILRTMGATQSMIMRVFFISGASVGTIGTLAGLLFGLLFSKNIETIRQYLQSFTGTDLFAAEIYFLSKLPAVVDSGEVITIVFMGLGLSFAATLYPSWRAAHLDPVDALRYE